MNKLERAMLNQARRHLYSFEFGKVVVREPIAADGNIVCTLAGDPMNSATLAQAGAICAALDKLAKKQGVIE